MPETAPVRTNKNWLLVKFRQWHSWGGVFLSLFILIVAVTGIILNHKDLILHGEEKKGPTGLLTSTMDLATVPVTFAQALTIAQDQFGDVPLEKVELKDDHGRLIYKVLQGQGKEIIIDAQSGDVSSKYGMRLASGGKPAKQKQAGLNWGKIVDDLHTGKILGTPGKLTVDLTSLVIIALTLSGLYLWGVPLLRKRQSALKREAAPPRRPQPHPVSIRAKQAAVVEAPEPETVAAP